MASVVLGIGTSHTPQVSMGASMWPVHAQAVDVHLVDFDARAAQVGDAMADQISSQRFEERYAACQANIEELGSLLRGAAPDVVLVIGDDHREVFSEECSPGIAVYCGNEVWDLPSEDADLPLETLRVSDWAYHGQAPVKYDTHGALGTHIAAHLSECGFDPTVVERLADGKSLGHAFTFVKRRLAAGWTGSLLPVWLNAFYPPNRPSARRCFEIGQGLRAAIERWPGEERIAIVASGGLSHYIVDEHLDHTLLAAIAADDEATLCAVPDEMLESGSGEIRMWIAAAGALRGLTVTHSEYVPGYRSMAGTGVGCGFTAWT
jgi:3-O-methylgallate 3,4-dioxygenase